MGKIVNFILFTFFFVNIVHYFWLTKCHLSTKSAY